MSGDAAARNWRQLAQTQATLRRSVAAAGLTEPKVLRHLEKYETIQTAHFDLRFDPKLHAAMQPYPPLGTLYAASWLARRRGEHGRARALALLGAGVAVVTVVLAALTVRSTSRPGTPKRLLHTRNAAMVAKR